MMQASQAEYLLMVADNLGSDSNGDTAYVNLHGDLPYEIENKLKEGYGRFNQVGNSHVLLRADCIWARVAIILEEKSEFI